MACEKAKVGECLVELREGKLKVRNVEVKVDECLVELREGKLKVWNVEVKVDECLVEFEVVGTQVE